VQRSAPTRARVLTDGHAGNVRQARALADALGLPMQGTTLQARAPWKWAAPRSLPGSHAAFGDALADIGPDVIAIGCGRRAALATRIARMRGARAVQILDPRIDPRHWDIVVVPEHDRLRGANVLTLLGSLNPVGDAWLGAARAAFAELAHLPQPRTALLVGGPTSSLRVGAREFDRWLAMVRHAIERDGGSVLATTSRRTPPAFVAAMRRRLVGLPGLVWTGSVDGRNPYAALLGWADRIVCSADSVNMLSEAAATTVPVHAAGLALARGRAGRFVQALAERGRIRALDDTLSPFEAVPLRETVRIAAQVRERLGLESGQGR
jgi:mitochondrial fission protein ELM1